MTCLFKSWIVSSSGDEGSFDTSDLAAGNSCCSGFDSRKTRINRGLHQMLQRFGYCENSSCRDAYLIAGFALVSVANVYMSLFARIRLEVKRERVQIKKEEKGVE